MNRPLVVQNVDQISRTFIDHNVPNTWIFCQSKWTFLNESFVDENGPYKGMFYGLQLTISELFLDQVGSLLDPNGPNK